MTENAECNLEISQLPLSSTSRGARFVAFGLLSVRCGALPGCQGLTRICFFLVRG